MKSLGVYLISFNWKPVKRGDFVRILLFEFNSVRFTLSRRQKVISREVMSPETFSQVARNFIMLHNIQTFAPVSFHQIFKKKIYYSFIPLVSSHHRTENEIGCTFISLVLSHHSIIA